MTAIRVIMSGALLAWGLTATPASAVVTTFATYEGVGGANLDWKRSGTTYDGSTAASAATARATRGGDLYSIASPASQIPGSVKTTFSFVEAARHGPLAALAGLGALDATLTFRATASPGTSVISVLGYDIQTLSSGSFSFIYRGTADLLVGKTPYHTGANLLSGRFFGGGFSAADGGTSGPVRASTSVGQTVIYSSDFLNFAPTTAEGFEIGLSSITPSLGLRQNQAVDSFIASSRGGFYTDPAPLPIAKPVSEPATLGLLVAGFGLAALCGRRRAAPVVG